MGYRIGIQILSYNKPKYLVQVLESLMQTKSDTDKIMVFEQSDDPKIREEGLNICRKFDDVQCIVSTENLGQRGATNKVIQSGFFDDCGYVMLSDHDNIFHEKLDIYIDKLDQSPEIWISTGYNSPEHDIEDKDGQWVLKTTARAGHMTLRQTDFMSMTPIDEKAGLDNGCAWFCGLDWWLSHWSPQAPGLRRSKIIAAFPGGVEHAGRESTWQGAYDDEYTVEENLKFRESTMEEILTFYKPRHTYQKGKYWYETNPPKSIIESAPIADDTTVKDFFKTMFNKDLSETELTVISKFMNIPDKMEYDEVFTDGIIAFNYIWPNYGYEFLELSIRSILPYVTKYVIYINKYSYIGKPCPDENIQWVNDVIKRIGSDKIIVHYKDDPDFPEHAKQDNVGYYFLKCIDDYLGESEYVLLCQSDEMYDDDNINKLLECDLGDADAAIFQPWCYLDTPQWRVDPPEDFTRPTLVRNKTSVNLKHKIKRLDITFHHYSYVLMQDELEIKFENWGHRNDVNVDQFAKTFNSLKSNKHLTNLHPIHGPIYKSVKFDGTALSKTVFKYWITDNCETPTEVINFVIDNLLSKPSSISCYSANDIGLSNIDHHMTFMTDNYDEYLDVNKYTDHTAVYGSMIDGMQHIEAESLDMFIYHADGAVEPLQHDLVNLYSKLKNCGWGCCVYRNNSQFEMLLRMIIRNGQINDGDGQIFSFKFNEVIYSLLPDGEYNVCIFRVNLDNSQLLSIDSDKVVFGPFVGEFGWELARWAPMVNKYKSLHPDADVVVATHIDSFGLYDNIVGYHIDAPDLGRDGFRNRNVPPNEYGEILATLVKSYPEHTVVTPLEFEAVLNVFSWEDRLIEYCSTPMAEKAFKTLIGDRIPIAISSRNILGKDRNWNNEYWEIFYQLINDSDKYFGIVVGKSPTIFKTEQMDNILYAENYINDDFKMIDVNIAALRVCMLCVGQQSSLPILSQFVETPTLMFGHRKYRNMNFDNPKNVRKMFIENPDYDITPEELYNAMDKFVMKLKG